MKHDICMFYIWKTYNDKKVLRGYYGSKGLQELSRSM